MSEDAEESDANQSKFYRVVSSEPVIDVNELFDTLSKFLMKDKKRQIATEYLNERDQIYSRLTWNNLRHVANSVLEEGTSTRQPVQAWIEQKEAIELDGDNETLDNAVTLIKQDPDQKSSHGTATVGEGANNSNKESEKRAAKKAKKEAKEARKLERAEKREARKSKKAAKAAKKIKKEAKKRKREEV